MVEYIKAHEQLNPPLLYFQSILELSGGYNVSHLSSASLPICSSLFSLRWDCVRFGISSGENETQHQHYGLGQDFHLLLWECGSFRFFFFFLLSMFCFPHFLWSLNSSFMGTSFMWFGWIWLHPLSTQTGMWSRPGQVALLKSLVQVEWHEPSQKTRVFLGTFFPELSGKRHSFSLLGLWAIRMMSA